MKSIRQDLSKGINAVLDRRLVPDGFAIIADNVDVRSGSARPFRMPEYHLEATAGTTRAYSYRGKWYFSSLYRRYAAELYGNQERVYFCEEGPSHVAPQKIVNGVQAPLGAMVPLSQAAVSNSTPIYPQSVVATLSGGAGNLVPGTYSYRVAAIINNAIMPPSGTAQINITTTSSAVEISWAYVPGATGYVVFGRTPENEQTIATLGVTNSFLDSGGYSPAGAFASNYDMTNPLSYVYTYVRTVGPMVDESGPSPLSTSTNAVMGRNITRVVAADGFYDNATTYSSLTTTASTSPATFISWLPKNGGSTIWLGSTPSPAFTSGQKIRISTTSGGTPIPASDDFTLSVPTALATPSAPVAGTAVGTSGLSAGTYIWKLAAIRGTMVIQGGQYVGATTVPSASSASKTLASSASVPLTWTPVNGADGYILYRSADSGSTWNQIKHLQGQITNYTDDGTNENTGVTLPAANTTSTQVIVLNQVLLSDYGIAATVVTAPVTVYIYLSKTEITVGANSITTGDAVFIEGASIAALNGVQDATVVNSTTISVPVFSSSNGTITTLKDIPGNNYYTAWRIYRTGDTGSEFLFVAEVPITEDFYVDTVTTVNLGSTLPTAYTDEQGAIVSFAPPPKDMQCPTLYNGMLFGISGNSVIWGPTGYPDAMPAAYAKSFEYTPLALKEFSGGLIVLCENGLYRADGFSAATIAFQPTRANDGCIAPYSVASIGNGLLYLAKRGVMLFDGQTSTCLTENNIPYKMLISPSNYTSPYSAQTCYWYTTEQEAQYGALLAASMNKATAEDVMAYTVMRDVPIDGPTYDIAAFAWQNKYFLYYRDIATSDYTASTCWCIDLALPGFPVTTLGIKPVDAHVSGLDEAYVLLKDNEGDPTNIEKLIQAQAQYNATFSPSASTSLGVYRFNPVYGQNIPIRLRSPEVTDGTPHLRKKWRQFRIHGDGTAQIRIYLDGVLMTMANGNTEVTMTCVDQPTDPRGFWFPPGSWGYSVAYEIVGDVSVRAVELGYDHMSGEE